MAEETTKKTESSDAYIHKYVPFEEYKDYYKQAIILERTDDGILTVRIHTKGGPALWTSAHHDGMAQLTRLIGQDPENEVVIFTGTGDKWTDNMPIDMDTTEDAIAEEGAEVEHKNSGKDALDVASEDMLGYYRSLYDNWYVDGQDLLKNMIFDINVPTIGVINGPGCGHWEFAQACDLCICSDDTYFSENHFVAGPGFVPGDGQTLVHQHLVGTRRAAYMALTGVQVSAQTALEWGLVNEVLPREQLMPRAMELAESIMQRDRIVRRLTHDILRQPWKHALVDNPGESFEFSLECWSAALTSADQLREACLTLGPAGMAQKEEDRKNGVNCI